MKTTSISNSLTIARIVLPLLLLMSGALVGYAQNPVAVTGRTIDSLGVPIAGVVVMIQSTETPSEAASAPNIDVTVTDSDGRFEFSAFTTPYSLAFRHMSYAELTLSDLTAGEVGAVILTEAGTEIESVVVRGRRPMVKAQGGKLIYDGKMIAEGKAVANAFEAIAQMATVTSEGNNLSLTGASGTTIILNGKPSVMSREQIIELLKATPVERLGTVETTYNAPPQWHTVGAVININLTRDPNQLNGQLSGDYSRITDADNYGATANLYLSGRRLFGDVMVHYSRFGTSTEQVEEFRHYVQGTPHDIIRREDNSLYGYRTTLYGSLGYRLKNENNVLNLSYYGDIVPGNRSRSRIENNTFGNGLTSGRYHGAFHGTTLTYESANLSAGMNYTYWFDIKNDLYTGEEIIDNQNVSAVHRGSAYVDASVAADGGWTFDYGARFTLVHNRATQISQQTSPEGEPADTEIRSVLNEYDTNAYIGLSHKFDNSIDLSATLTGNYYSIEDYDSFNLLPRLSLTWPVSDGHTVQLSGYGRRIKPSYTQQSDYRYYTDAYNISEGNPHLRPKTQYTADVSYILKDRYTFSLIYQYTDRQIVNDGFMSPTELAMITQPLNINFMEDVILTVSAPLRFTKAWSADVNIMGDLQRYKADNWNGIAYDIRRLGAQITLDNYFTISKQRPEINLTLSGRAVTAVQNTIHKVPARWYVNAGAMWVFAAKKMVLSVRCNDIFESYVRIYRSTIPEQQQYLDYGAYRSITASLSYRFGNYRGTRMRTGGMDTSRAQ